MNHEQLAFFNQQLAAMLQSGLPLESSLKQLSASMQRGPLRTEVTALETDLEQGTPLEEALGRRKLPELYVSMLRAGLKGNDLAGLLTLAADYYGHQHTTWLRLKGLMVYPAIVLVTSLGVSAFLAFIYTRLIGESAGAFNDFSPGQPAPGFTGLLLQVWFPVALLAVATLLFFIVLWNPRLRNFARWHLPGFREASLSQLASTVAVMLEHGVDLGAALEVAQKNETSATARREIGGWRQRLAGGARRFTDLAQSGTLAPPLFVWLIASAGENWAHGFRRAAEIYDGRAKYRTELALYVALPIMILLLAAIIFSGMLPLVRGFTQMMGAMSDMGGE
jgi:type II secretory pathway component PulF